MIGTINGRLQTDLDLLAVTRWFYHFNGELYDGVLTGVFIFASVVWYAESLSCGLAVIRLDLYSAVVEAGQPRFWKYQFKKLQFC